ncbi:MAG: cobalt transporter CbiM [Clostridium sp.]|nr:cobalt transporter CbiM [Clostridium sp.]
MHIPENYLSPSTCAVMAAAAVPAIAVSAKKVKENISKDKMVMLGVFAAFSFVAMMFNIPLPGGTTGHAVGGTLIAIILGPEAACLSVAVTLAIQALLFGDGGVLALGANIFNIAFVLPYVGHAVYTLIKNKSKSKAGEYVGAAVGAYVGINAAALITAVEFGIQPYLFKDASGQALYCPYGLNVSIPAMMAGHLTLFGLAEVIFTVAVLAFIKSTSPELVKNQPQTKKSKTLIGVLLAVLVCLTPIGLLATGTAWGEWGVEDMIDVAGFVPGGMENGVLDGFSAICPDYAIGSLPEWIGYILSAVIGIAIAVILFKLISAFMKDKVKYAK